MTTTPRALACQAIEDAIHALVAYYIDAEHFDEDDIVTDAVLILGGQYIDSDGDRNGRVTVFPRHGSQPPYITIGLLESAQRLIDHCEA